METEEKGKVKDIEKKLYEFLRDYDEIDVSSIKN